MIRTAVSEQRVKRVETLDLPELAIYRSVRDPQLLREHGVFMAESREVVRTLVSRSRFKPRSLLLTDAALKGLAEVIDTLPEDIPVFVASRSAINEVVGFDIHRGCLAACDRSAMLTAAEVIEGTGGASCLLVGLSGVNNPDNTGGIFRNAVAFGVDGVLLDSPSADPLYRKSIRTSMGSTLTLPFAWVDDWLPMVARLRSQGFVTAAFTPDADAEPLESYGRDRAVPERVLVLLGNEGLGLSRELMAAADVRVRIAMMQGFDSINVAAASAVALHHFAWARAAPGAPLG